jgi:NAD(P)-dependent dehydrogenase (short-subunit alcohol dehydrogenase family)
VAHEVEPFGIRIVTVEPGFFRTDLLDAQHAKYASNSIEGYAAEGKAEAMWSGYHGTQQGDPARLGDVLVKIAGMDIHQGNSRPAATRLRWSSRRSKHALRNCEHTRTCPSQRTAVSFKTDG